MKKIAAHHRLASAWKLIPAGLIAAGLAACNASADLAATAPNEARALQRFDQFQAAADNGKVLVVVGANGVVVTSADRGASWQRREIGAGASLIGAAACPDGSFAALDFFHRVWLADAGGEQWASREIGQPANPLAIACDSRNALWVAGSDSTIARSADRGASWTKTTVGDDAMLTGIQFIDARRAFVTGEFGAVYRSDDGGASWQALPRIGDDFYPYAAHFADAERGWVSGLAGVVMQTSDGGQTWSKQANPLGAPIYGLASLAGGAAVGVGVNGLLFRQENGRWALGGAYPTSYLRAALPLPDGRILLAGGAGTVEITALATPPGSSTPAATH